MRIAFSKMFNATTKCLDLNVSLKYFKIFYFCSGVYSAAGFQVKLQRKQMQFVVQVSRICPKISRRFGLHSQMSLIGFCRHSGLSSKCYVCDSELGQFLGQARSCPGQVTKYARREFL